MDEKDKIEKGVAEGLFKIEKWKLKRAFAEGPIQSEKWKMKNEKSVRRGTEEPSKSPHYVKPQ